MLGDADFHSASVRKEAEGSTAQSGQTPVMPKPVEGTIGFIGLGHMGSAMAANLAASGCKVTGLSLIHI